MAAKKNNEKPADPVPKKRIRRTEKPETDAVEVPDAASETVSKLDNQKLLNFLKYRADPDKNKRGEQLHEAQKVLEARCFPPNCFPTTCDPQKFFLSFFPKSSWSTRKTPENCRRQNSRKNTGDKTPEKIQETKLQKNYRRQNSRKNTGDKTPEKIQEIKI